MKRNKNKYYDKRSACQVIGVLMQEPQKIKERKYHLTQDDFSVDTLHNIIFTCIYNLAHQGIKKIDIPEIEGYLSVTSPVDHSRVFEKSDGAEWIKKVLETAVISNFDYHYNRVKKMSLLRNYIEQGIDVSEILNRDEFDPKLIKVQEESFDKLTLDDIIREIDTRHLNAKRGFIIRDSSESRKAGEGAKELRERMKESPSFGLGLESEYLNTITRGAVGGNYVLETRDSGNGKSRIAIRRLLNITAPYLWCPFKKDFIKNPNGTGNSGLYIGTEMDLYRELEPMMWSFVSGVDTKTIKDGTETKEESKRIEKAIEILDETKLFLVDESNFTTSFLWQTIEEYKLKHNICAVMLDYIELNGSLVAEYVEQTRGMSAREDQVLLNLSENLKLMARDFDVFLNAFTQTTDEARRDGVRDQRAVKGARSLPNKCDIGIVTFEPTKKELEQVAPIVARQKGLVEHKQPNVYYYIYKNRGEEYKNVKVWAYQDLGTMQITDLFCTDRYNKLIDIDKTKILVDDTGQAQVTG